LPAWIRCFAAVPGIRSAGLAGAVRDFDGATNDAPLVLDALRSAVHYGQVIASYASLTDNRWACRIVDREAGAGHAVGISCGNLLPLALARRN